MERSEIRGGPLRVATSLPHFASLHAGYGLWAHLPFCPRRQGGSVQEQASDHIKGGIHEDCHRWAVSCIVAGGGNRQRPIRAVQRDGGHHGSLAPCVKGRR